jgi:predicted ArsR family transcriptional regulator
MTVYKGQHYLLGDDAPAQAHSPTSVAAAKSQKPKKTEIDREKILVALAKHGPLTDEEIVERTGLGANTARPRRVELVRAGLVVAVGEGRTAGGHRASTWGVIR